jgi:hypothetical protein
MAAVALVAALAPVRIAAAEDDPWARGTNWMTIRGGYAKSTVDGAGNGGAGYGLGYARMLHPVKIWRWTLFSKFSLGGYAHYEVLGKVGSAAEIEIPATAELVRHFDWNSSFHPYLGLGTGPMYRKTYRTGLDARNVAMGYYLTLGGNIPVKRMHLLGADVRIIRVKAVNDPPNPVFGLGAGEFDVENGRTVVKSNKGTHWSAKVGYTVAY